MFGLLFSSSIHHDPSTQEAFRLIVSTFEERLVDKATPPILKKLSRRTSILESLDKARVMVDFICDALNIAMIQILLKAIRYTI